MIDPRDEQTLGEVPGVRVTRAKVTTRGVDVLAPPEYSERDIRHVREGLGVSQAVFAELIGASASTVRAWERGARQPSEMARRLIALAERDPDVFAQDLVPAGTIEGRSRRAILESLVEDELLEWYLMTPQDRWTESQRLWTTYTLLGGSLEPQPDSQSPFDFSGTRGGRAADGRPGVYPIRRSGV